MNIEEVLEFTKNFYIEKKRKGTDKSANAINKRIRISNCDIK